MLQNYDLELDAVVDKIKKENSKVVCIQLPEGLRPYAAEIVKDIQSKTSAKVIIWLGSCWGACDLPLEVNRLGVDLLIQWGHSEWGH
ncbi:diphthamide synthesis protein [Candidatus Woesearchaeota archaeon]|nr:diphthamide synthesis protein [Candidatus Woesearchaeota archaeon]